MRKNNSGIVIVEALLIMSILALFSLGIKNKELKKDNETQEQKIEECERLENYLDHQEWKKYER